MKKGKLATNENVKNIIINLTYDRIPNPLKKQKLLQEKRAKLCNEIYDLLPSGSKVLILRYEEMTEKLMNPDLSYKCYGIEL